MAQKFLTLKQFVDASGKSMFYIRKLLREGKLNAEKKIVGDTLKWVIPYSELERYKKEIARTKDGKKTAKIRLAKDKLAEMNKILKEAGFEPAEWQYTPKQK